MTYYSPTFSTGIGIDYFESLGIIGGATGMQPVLSSSYVFPTPDSSNGTAMTVNGSVIQSDSAAATSWIGWNLGASYTKALGIMYTQPSYSDFTGIGFNSGTLPAAAIVDAYEVQFKGTPNPLTKTNISVYNSGIETELDNDVSICQLSFPSDPVWGLAIWVASVDASTSIKAFARSCTGQWIQVVSDTDASFSSFQSMFLSNNGENARFICPVFCWAG